MTSQGATDFVDPPDRGRVLALDLGDRRVGVAVCDDARTVATPYQTLKRVGDRPKEHEQIEALVAETGATAVVVGLPVSLDGGQGPAARKVLSEVKALRKRLGPCGVAVVTHDERNTTVTAGGSLRDQGVKARNRRAVIDQVAAAVILQDWIDRRL